MTLDEEDVAAIAAAVVRLLRADHVAPARPPQRLSKAELAQALRRTPATVDRWVASGMPCDNMGSYRLFDLDTCRRWVAARPRKVEPKPTPAPTVPPGVELRTRKAA